ncbi:MAG: hypothetical protein HUU21_34045 [Polyangiaceae bacterium]|nr:hypothetical protein [Polyangiaceae bacterium]
MARGGLVLGIETSCDETSAAVVAEGRDVLSSLVSSQVALHEKYRGVVPEIAARAHVEQLVPLVEHTLGEACVRELDGGDIDRHRQHPEALAVQRFLDGHDGCPRSRRGGARLRGR